MKYVALESFTDLQDNNYKYRAGDIFPREGLNVSVERIEELSTCNNRRGRAMIVAINSLEETQVESPDAPTTTPNKRGRKKANAE